LSSHPLSLKNLNDPPGQNIFDALAKAERLVSPYTGIISKVELEDLYPSEPPVFFARSTPSSTQALGGNPIANYGDAVSIEPERAMMKAMGESLERYSPAFHNQKDWLFSSWNDLKKPAVDPDDMALFSKKQYALPDFSFQPFTRHSATHWVNAFSLTAGKDKWAPASFIYLPYFFNREIEPKTHNPISTGLACGSCHAMAIQKGILEILERDAFMITWKNKIPAAQIEYPHVSSPLTQKMLEAVAQISVDCRAYLLWHDVGVPVILVLLENISNTPPLTVMGIAADLDPERALALALEEACLGYIGMNRYTPTQTHLQFEKNYENVNTLDLHGLAHALDPNLKSSWKFLNSGNKRIKLDKIKNQNTPSMTRNIKTMVGDLKKKGLEVLACDLTTPDLDENGFKVVRSMIPGMLSLDTDHTCRYLGGKRLYDVPLESGKIKKKNTETSLNPFPHMFP